VSWRVDERVTRVSFRLPPISVPNVSGRQVVAIAGNFSEFGGDDLMLYE
jgi:hypothetical protein